MRVPSWLSMKCATNFPAETTKCAPGRSHKGICSSRSMRMFNRPLESFLRKHEKLMGVGGGRNAADPFVIGLATARDATVVTEEQPKWKSQQASNPGRMRRSWNQLYQPHWIRPRTGLELLT